MVQARIHEGLVAPGQALLVDLPRTAEHLGDVVAGELHVQAGRDRAQLLMDLEEAHHLVEDVLEASGLVAVRGGDRVAVHRVGHPGDLGAGIAHTLDERREPVADPPGPHAGDEGQPSRLPLGIQAVDQPQRVVEGGVGTELHPDGVAQPGHEVDMGAVELAGALPDPQEVARAAVDLPGAGVDPGEGLLVVQQQRLVGGVELDHLERVEVRADRVHEAHGLVDLPGELLVPVVAGAG
jgi:hypothetical protein